MSNRQSTTPPPLPPLRTRAAATLLLTAADSLDERLGLIHSSVGRDGAPRRWWPVITSDIRQALGISTAVIFGSGVLVFLGSPSPPTGGRSS